MVSLWDLLTFLSGACAFAGALAAARLEGGGPLKLAIGVFLGLLLGFSSFYLVGIASSRVGLPIQPPDRRQGAHAGCRLPISRKWRGLSSLPSSP